MRVFGGRWARAVNARGRPGESSTGYIRGWKRVDRRRDGSASTEYSRHPPPSFRPPLPPPVCSVSLRPLLFRLPTFDRQPYSHEFLTPPGPERKLVDSRVDETRAHAHAPPSPPPSSTPPPPFGSRCATHTWAFLWIFVYSRTSLVGARPRSTEAFGFMGI